MKRWMFLIFFVPLFGTKIDVVIPVHKKDVPTLGIIIDAVEKNVVDLGKIVIISKENYTDRAEWVDEAIFPFTIEDMGHHLGKKGVGRHKRRGWYYQQLLKFYAHVVIDGLSEHILILDADTKINKKIRFIHEDGKPILDTMNCGCCIKNYYVHMQKLLPNLTDINMKVNPITHHMVFSKEIINDLFSRVEERYGLPFWVVFCNEVITHKNGRPVRIYVGASEYMIYYHFCRNYYREKTHSRMIKLNERVRSLHYSNPKFDFVTKHNYKR